MNAPHPFVALDEARAELRRALESLPGHRPVPLDPGLSSMRGLHGSKELSLEASAFEARGVAYGRSVSIRGEDTWIENTVLFSDPRYALPVLGVELLVFRGRMHLIVADLFPLSGRDEGVMDDLGPRYRDVGDEPPMPAWAASIFSRAPVFRKPRREDALPQGAAAMREVSSAWLARARAAEVEVEPGAVAEASRRLLEYTRRHAEDEPAGPFLSRAFGEGGARLLPSVLFPLQALASRLSP